MPSVDDEQECSKFDKDSAAAASGGKYFQIAFYYDKFH